MKLIFLGPPGAGKGTQATGVSSHLRVPHISTGDMFRSALREMTPTGVEAKKYMDEGKLVPDSVVIAMVKERLAKPDCENGYLLDGFPRTVEQAQALDTFAEPDAVVCIEVSDEKLLDRLTGRRSCTKCAGIFHISKLADEKTCPVCGAELFHRADDQPETISKRLQVYHEQTTPLVGYYEELGKLKRIDGSASMEDVFHNILASLE